VLVLVGAGALELSSGHARRPTCREGLDPAFQNQSAMPRVDALADLVACPHVGAAENLGAVCISTRPMNLSRPVLVKQHVG